MRQWLSCVPTFPLAQPFWPPNLQGHPKSTGAGKVKLLEETWRQSLNLCPSALFQLDSTGAVQITYHLISPFVPQKGTANTPSTLKAHNSGASSWRLAFVVDDLLSGHVFQALLGLTQDLLTLLEKLPRLQTMESWEFYIVKSKPQKKKTTKSQAHIQVLAN